MENNTLLQQILDTDFTIQATPVPSGTGYCLRLKANWRSTGLKIQYRVQLAGLNPLTARDVLEENVSFSFNYGQQTDLSGTLRYHGSYTFLCFASVDSGEEIKFAEVPITLRCPDSIPYLSYSIKQPSSGFFKKRQGYWEVIMHSNCWPYCQEKVWLHFDGHDQLVVFSETQKDTFRFYLVTQDRPSVRITDKNISLREE